MVMTKHKFALAVVGALLSIHATCDQNRTPDAVVDRIAIYGQRAATIFSFVAMNDAGEGVHRLAIHEHIQLHHVGAHIIRVLVIHRTVTARDTFNAVVEIDQNLVERQ